MHLGSKHSHAKVILHFLEQFRPRHVYLVGDIVDGFYFGSGWNWNHACTELLKHFLGLHKAGTKLHYIAGNHDHFFRELRIDAKQDRHSLGQGQLVHESLLGQRYLLTHGDCFEQQLRQAKGLLGRLVDWSCERILDCNSLHRKWLALRRKRYRCLTQKVKSLKAVQTFLARYEELSSAYARRHGFDGIICGHIHVPRFRMVDGTEYYNLGDWTENRSAMVEFNDGSFELLSEFDFHEGRPSWKTLFRSAAARGAVMSCRWASERK